MSDSTTTRQCKTPGCKKTAEPDSDYCLACHQQRVADLKRGGAKAAGILSALGIAIGVIIKIATGGRGGEKG